MPWMSCSKIPTSVAFALVWERGLVKLDAPVCQYVPEFASGGKHTITLRHLLTHTAGLLSCERALGPVRYQNTFADNVRVLYETPADADWRPGTRAGYLTTSAMLRIAEVIRRVAGRSFDTFMREAVFVPLGMQDSWIGMPPDGHAGFLSSVAFADPEAGLSRGPIQPRYHSRAPHTVLLEDLST
jgi:CubicO group peptidase (beta-lactamase class C family)